MAALCVFFCPQTISLLNLGGATGPAYVLKFQGKLVFLLMFISWKTGQQTWLFQMLVQCNQSVTTVHNRERETVLLHVLLKPIAFYWFACFSWKTLKFQHKLVFLLMFVSWKTGQKTWFFQMLVQWNQSVNVHNRKGKLYYCSAIETDSVTGLHAFPGKPLKKAYAASRVRTCAGKPHWISSPTP